MFNLDSQIISLTEVGVRLLNKLLAYTVDYARSIRLCFCLQVSELVNKIRHA